MIKVQINDSMRVKAKQHAIQDKERHGFNKSCSFVNDKNRFLGSLGEEIVSSYFKTPLDNNTDYDIILNNERVEIKSQGLNVDYVSKEFKAHTIKLCSNCDKYMFVIIHNSFNHAWIVGQIDREKFNSTCTRERFKDTLEYIISLSELEEIA